MKLWHIHPISPATVRQCLCDCVVPTHTETQFAGEYIINMFGCTLTIAAVAVFLCGIGSSWKTAKCAFQKLCEMKLLNNFHKSHTTSTTP